MLWTREAVLAFTERAFAEYTDGLPPEKVAELARKARIIDFDAVKALKRTDPKLVVTADVQRYYVKER